jgi:hypothetical protein
MPTGNQNSPTHPTMTVKITMRSMLGIKINSSLGLQTVRIRLNLQMNTGAALP